MLTLTVEQIKDLAEFAGFTLHSRFMPEEMVSEVVICECPANGVKCEGEPSDPMAVAHYKHVAYFAEYPDEGCHGLGPEVDAP